MMSIYLFRFGAQMPVGQLHSLKKMFFFLIYYWSVLKLSFSKKVSVSLHKRGGRPKSDAAEGSV